MHPNARVSEFPPPAVPTPKQAKLSEARTLPHTCRALL